MKIILGDIGSAVVASAEPEGWWMRPITGVEADLSRRTTWPPSSLNEPDGVSVAIQAETLLDLEIGEAAQGGVLVRWDQFSALLRQDIQLPFRWTSWSPLMLSIDRASEIGRTDFRYLYSYRFGGRETEVERVGYFIRRKATGQVYHLDEQTFALVDAMDQFNLPANTERQPVDEWLTFATVKGCSALVGADLDAYLASNDVVVPSQIALDIYVHDDESISFVPKVAGLPERGLREAFLRNADAKGLYVLDGGDGRRLRVVLADRHRQVVERMKQVRRLRGAAREAAQNDPAQFFDGLLDSIEIRYGPRVIGIGDFPFASPPAPSSAGGGFLDGPICAKGMSNEDSERSEPQRLVGITLPRAGGAPDVTIHFKDRHAVTVARDAIAAAIESGAQTATVQGKEVAATTEALDALSATPVDMIEGTERARGSRFLLVYTNEDELRSADSEAATRASQLPATLATEPRIPKSLRAAIRLMPHQRDSVLWLQRCEAIDDRRGVLLADDMGLGKTLQILTFLASRVEAGHLRWNHDSLDDEPPWRPMLIVAPLILIENETWTAEMRQFFANDGNVFEPTLILHGSGIDEVRDSCVHGAETATGRPMLSAEKLMRYRTIITNYETIVNYQHSLAQLTNGRSLWSAIVTDEAQKYKGMNTKVSMALKAIAGDFHIASTGTPVENRLLDLWNIIDTIQPALLGPAKEFALTYEHPIGSGDEPNTLADLRQRLLVGQPHAFLIRRTKDDLLDMPHKNVELLLCEMSPAERGLHTELLSALSRERRHGRHLAVLHKLTLLYQHPALLRGDWESRAPTELVAESSKLTIVMEQLHRIRGRGEKVIIFARQLNAQHLLARVIGAELNDTVPIINGSTSRGRGLNDSSSSTVRAKNERKRILDEFRDRAGFAVLILSPFVAGIGLTITEANHVIHYGRWWNPAVESQATDRAYRIGQKREVTVYLPILRDPTGQIERSFDECLQQLLEAKAALAKDFLHPADEDQNVSELCSMLHADGSEVLPEGQTPFTSSDLDHLDPADFEAAVGALYRALGYRVVLTANGGDAGADVLAFKPGDAILIQVKHSAGRTAVDDRALNDVLAACDVYGGRLRVRWKATVVSNAPIAPSTLSEAERSGIETIAGDRLARLISEMKVGFGATAACAAGRCASFDEGIRQATAYLAT